MRVIEKGIACENTVHRRTRPRRDSLRVHRRTAGDASVFLVLSGLVLSVIQLGSVRALIETQYGIILSIKLALVILLLGLAALNRFLFTPAVVADYENTRPLLRSILTECVLVVCILAVVAGWRFTPPPRASVAPAAAPLSVHIHTDAAMFQVLVSPGKVGANDFVLQLMTGDAPCCRRSSDADPELAGARHRADERPQRSGRTATGMCAAWRCRCRDDGGCGSMRW